MFYPKEFEDLLYQTCFARGSYARLREFIERDARSLAIFMLVNANAPQLSPPNVRPTGGVMNTQVVSRQNAV